MKAHFIFHKVPKFLFIRTFLRITNFIMSQSRILQSNLLLDEIADNADDVSQLSRELTESNRLTTPLMSDFNRRLNPFSPSLLLPLVFPLHPAFCPSLPLCFVSSISIFHSF